MDYKGTIIEESLEDKSVLSEIKILRTKVEKVTDRHQTPWIKQWTLHAVEIPENQAKNVANKIKLGLVHLRPPRRIPSEDLGGVLGEASGQTLL
jgi:hypothetical protein